MSPPCDHVELVEEMKKLVKLPMEGRMAAARNRRREQVLRYNSDKSEAQRTRDSGRNGSTKRITRKRVQFDSTSVLFELVSDGDVEGVRNLIASNKCHKDVTNCHGMTALHQSCVNRNLGLIHVLIKELSANISKPDLELWTPLHTVALLGYPDVAKFLLDNGADPLSLNVDLNMPYDICEDVDTLNIIEMSMVNSGVTQEKIEELRMTKELDMLRKLKRAFDEDNSLMQKGPNEETLLHVAASLGYKEVAKFLLSKSSISIDDIDKDGWRAIHCASYWNQLSVVEVLMDHGACIFSKTFEDETALDLCRDETMRDWMQQKATMDSHPVRKASCVKRDARRASIQDQLGSSHFDSLVSLTDLNKFSHSSKRLNAEKKEEKKKRDVRHEYESLLTADPCCEGDSCTPPVSSFPSSPISLVVTSNYPDASKVMQESSLHPLEGKIEARRSQNGARNRANNLPSPRPETGYISVYNSLLKRCGQLDSPNVSPKDSPFDCQPSLIHHSPSFKSSCPAPSSPKEKQLFLYPDPTSGLESQKGPKQILRDRSGSKQNKTKRSSVKGLQKLFSQPATSQRSSRAGSLTTSNVDAFGVPKRINSSSDVSRLSGVQFYASDPWEHQNKSHGKKGDPSSQKSRKSGSQRCVVS